MHICPLHGRARPQLRDSGTSRPHRSTNSIRIHMPGGPPHSENFNLIKSVIAVATVDVCLVHGRVWPQLQDCGSYGTSRLHCGTNSIYVHSTRLLSGTVTPIPLACAPDNAAVISSVPLQRPAAASSAGNALCSHATNACWHC